MRFPLPGAAALIASLAALAAAAPPVAAQISFTPCGHSNSFACGHLTVPLDPGGTTPGTVTLAIERHRAPVGEARTAIVTLAGGPGQPALPFAEQFAELLGPIAATRDLIVFDQRGIGLSDPLSCHAFERLSASAAPARALAECAAQLGPSRAFFQTADTVADIEAIRRAGGYQKLVLYGTSYGTKVAEQYAEDYPGNVEALVLDSTVPPGGPDTLLRSTFAAIPRVLRQICAERACRGVTAEPVSDLARVLARMHGGFLRAPAIGPRGVPRTVPVSRRDLLALLLAGDFSAPLRAALVSADASAADGDQAPLGRLLSTASTGSSEGEDFDVPLYFDTTCEEQAFPWSRAASPALRLHQALAAARTLPASDFAPFSAADAVALSDIPTCANWSFTSPAPAPAPEAPLPALPTLILSGADDLRTPTANARAVQSLIPGAHLLVVPLVGHSVLGSDPTGCAAKALQALFSGGPVASSCPHVIAPPRLRPEPLPPPSLARVRPARGYSGTPGRTVDAIQLTLSDLARQLALTFEATVSEASLFALPSLRTGGLRSGWAQLAGEGLQFSDYSFVPGVTLTGWLRAETADLRIGGRAAAGGTLHLGSGHLLVGSLGGRHVSLPASSEPATAIVGSDARAGQALDPGGRGARTLLRRLAAVLGRLLGP